MGFLTNAWYVAAFGDDIGPAKTLGRTLLGENVTLYRTDQGRLAALQTACPHRFAPLHQGQVHGSDLACPYHGLRFNPEGQCVHNPHGKGEIPKAARVRSYPVEERDGLVWIWMGEAERCDRTRVPEFPQLLELPPQTRISAHIHS